MHVLLVSHDMETVAAFHRSGGEMGVELYPCESAKAADDALQRQRYDAIIVDCDDTHGGTGVLKAVRAARANRSTVVLAVLNGGTHDADAVDLGANLVLHKPVSNDVARQEFRRLRTMVGQEQRQHIRYRATGEAYVTFGGVIDRRAEIVNLALGGMGLRFYDPVDHDEILSVRFQLPGTATVVQARGEIAWADPQGIAGIKFVSLSSAARAELEKWLHTRAKSSIV
jgi:CheY-like chemotaxis protein